MDGPGRRTEDRSGSATFRGEGEFEALLVECSEADEVDRRGDWRGTRDEGMSFFHDAEQCPVMYTDVLVSCETSHVSLRRGFNILTREHVVPVPRVLPTQGRLKVADIAEVSFRESESRPMPTRTEEVPHADWSARITS